LLLALLIGRLFHHHPLATWTLDPRGVLLSAAATVPPVAALVAILRSARPAWRDLVRTVERAAGDLIAPLSPWQVVLLSALAGLGEEAMFRGLLQSGLASLVGMPVALVLASLAFGGAHLVTASYAVVATVMGLYLGWLFALTDNVAVPALVHGLYDAAAIAILRRRLSLHEGGVEL
jgi:membrane protease YdiL (CAAX protease family)